MTTATTPQYIFQAGEIRRAEVAFRLYTGDWEGDEREILLLDVRPRENGTTDLLWESMSGIGEDGLPSGPPRWTSVDPTGQHRSDTMRLRVHEPTGRYRPQDPAYNSLEILRDRAIARVEQDRAWRARHRPADVQQAAAAFRAAERAVEETREALYVAIRTALEEGASPIDLAATTGLSRARIYQIRDGRR